MVKVYPNDMCPCGSGKKYKYCCRTKKRLYDEDLVRSDLKLEDFVVEKICEDAEFLENALQLIIGPWGYYYCSEHKEELENEYRKDKLKSYVRLDKMQVYSTTAKSGKKKQLLNVRPYGGVVPDELCDIMSLLKNGHICVEGKQVELFHAYLLDNLSNRFKEYLYVPTETAKDGQEFGAFAHRGYDFLLGITLYLELQLGVHVYLYLMNPSPFSEEEKNACINFFGIEQIPVNTGMLLFLLGYAEVIEQISNKYNASEEVEIYHSIGAYTEEGYAERKKLITPGYYSKPLEYNYINYLRYLVSATCFNIGELYAEANMSFPQCDFVKYLFGLEGIIELFEEKIEQQDINPSENFDIELLKKSSEIEGDQINTDKKTHTRIDIYHSTVFWMMDELNGMSNHMKSAQLKYIDFADINDDDYTIINGMRNINPARKTTRVKAARKLRMELYNALNGKFFTLQVGDNTRDTTTYKIVGKYPILPWLSNGKEHTVHCAPFDGQPRTFEDLYSCDISKRQDFLTLEYRLTEIPINCIEEYLNPDVFYNWKERNELLKETKKQNEELKRHIQLNQELVRNLSHSSANYLNSDRLAKTGIELHKAEKDNPTLEELHLEGLSLLLQSEQEMYLSRQLNSLVWRCSADVDSLSQQIRSGLSKDDGVTILAPIEFSMKTVLARILFRDGDRRSDFIKDKIMKSDNELTQIKSSFMLNILANNSDNDGAVIDWWKQYIGDITIASSKIWNSIKIINEKSFYDLIVEIITEQILNFFSHGDVTKGVYLELGQAEEFKGRPRWAFISCENSLGKQYAGGRGVGISTLNETMRLLNSNKKGMDTKEEKGIFECKVWILSSLLKAL